MGNKILPYANLFIKSLGVSVYKNFGIGFQMPYKYTFMTTNICQSRCKSCGIWKIYKDQPEKLKTELTLEEYGRIFDNIKDDAFWVVLSGGEPFIRKDFDEIAILASEKMKKLFLVNIPTNGLTPVLIEKKTEKILQGINPKLNLFITVSLDGIGHIYEEVRGVDSYDKVIETYDRLNELTQFYKNFHVGFQTTVSKLNMAHVEEIFVRVKNTSMPIFTFANEAHYFYNIGSGVDVRLLEQKKLLEVIQFLYKNYKIRNFHDAIPKFYLKLAKQFYKNPSRQVLPCYATWATLTLDPYGNILPCSYFYKVMANVRNINYDIKSFMISPIVKETQKIIEGHNCPKCWTNCEAYPTMLQNPLATLKKFLL